MASEATHINANAFYRGIRAFIKGNLISPYKPNSLLDKEWQRGFNTQYFRNLSMLNKRKYRHYSNHINSNNSVRVNNHKSKEIT